MDRYSLIVSSQLHVDTNITGKGRGGQGERDGYADKVVREGGREPRVEGLTTCVVCPLVCPGGGEWRGGEGREGERWVHREGNERRWN